MPVGAAALQARQAGDQRHGRGQRHVADQECFAQMGHEASRSYYALRDNCCPPVVPSLQVLAMTKAAVHHTRVLFVCVENSNRSQMAEALARIHGAGRVEAYSAGSRPSGRVNPKAVAAMRELGYDLGKHTSKSLADIPDVEYDVAVTMGCGDQCPWVRARRREDWAIPDPKELPPDRFREVRDLIGEKVRELLGSFGD
jgi:protein-tyrosine-phosphatase